jgi:hypothetical protein
MKNPTQKDVEQLSAQLDGTLPLAKSTRLQERLQADPALVSVYQQLSQTKNLLRALPARRAPRNFTLRRGMQGLQAPVPPAALFLQWSSALATLLFVFALALNTALPWWDTRLAYSPLPTGRGGGMSDAAPQAESFTLQELPAAEAPVPDLAAPNPKAAPTCPIPEGWQAYTIQPGDTLIGLAQQAGATVPGLQEANCWYEENLYIDQVFYLPSAPLRSAPQPPIPSAALYTLLGLGAGLGAGAYLMRWRKNRALWREER